MNLTQETWDTPRICLDCRQTAPEGWQELKYSAGGPYLEKRCPACAETHYGEAELNQFKRQEVKKSAARKAGKEKAEAPLLGQTG